MKSNTIYPKILGHFLLWFLIFLLPFYANYNMFGFWLGTLRAALPILVAISITYLNVYVIVPKLFRFNHSQRLSLLPLLFYIPIIVVTGIVIYILIVLLNYWTGAYITIDFGVYKTDGTLLVTNSNFKHLPLVLTVLVVTLLLFASSLYALAFEFLKRERQEGVLQKENLQNELKFLRAQINPHFLFNAMNNLYAITQLRPQEAGGFVLKLSDMLRYVTYECKEEKVSLGKEIDYLHNYLFFQQQRDLDFQNIELIIDSSIPKDIQIEPMLLVPFVENCFKHSYTEDCASRWIKIQLKLVAQQLTFATQNSIPAEGGDQSNSQDEYMGIGSSNIERRLELLYKGKYDLNITANSNSYTVNLTIDLK